MAITAIASGTTAANSYDGSELDAPITLTADQTIQVYTDIPLGVGEEITVSFTPTGATPYYPLVDGNRQHVIVDHYTTRNTLRGPGEFGLSKSATVSATAVLYDV